MAMHRYSLIANTRNWGDMVVWCKENFGEAQAWGGVVLEPRVAKRPYLWVMGYKRLHPDDPDSMQWPCFWIPDGAAHTAFLLRWA